MKAKITNAKRLDILGNNNLLSNREALTAFLKRFRQKFGYFSIFTALSAIMTSLTQDAQAEEAKKPETPVIGQTTRLFEKLNKSCGKPNLLRSQSSYRLPHQKSKFDIISELVGGDNCPGNPIPGGTYTAAAPFTDSGSTTGANNTVNRVGFIDYCYYNYNAEGPDVIYSFTLTGRGANPQIQVSATSAGYNPMIYVLENTRGGCPAGTGNFPCSFRLLTHSQDGTATLNRQAMSFLPLNVPLFLFVDSNAANGSGNYTLRIQDVGIAPGVSPPSGTRFDFDGDGRSDISVFRPSDRVWYLNRSQTGFSATQFGLSDDKITPADFDGDGKTDIAVFRDGTWFWLNSSNGNFNAFQFGLANDIPVPADFTGDGRAELAVYRGGTWFTFDLTNNQFNAVQFGLSTDKPVVGDYDGDSRADFAVYRDGVWYLLRSQQGFAAIQFGLPTDKLVPADYDGDGKTDLAVFRDGVWYQLFAKGWFMTFQFGLAGDIPAPADYDGDGDADAAVYRDGIWYLKQGTNSFAAVQFGLASDKPTPTAFLP